ncbi:MAG: NAD(+) synthase [Bacteroidota bacterium]
MKTDLVAKHITKWLKDYAKNAGIDGFVIGISGGIDSAVTSALCAKTGLRTLCVEMPIHQELNQVNRAQNHIEDLKSRFANVTNIKVDLTKVFDSFLATTPSFPENDLVLLSQANTRARLRMTTLYYFAGIHRYLVVGTGNKVEDFGVGFYTKYGDGGVDLSPIADLMKSEVFELARHLAIIDEIQQAKPTDGLFGDDRTDEDQLGATYDELEWAMNYKDSTSTERLSNRQAEVLEIYKKLNRANQHKMNPIPICTIPDVLKK